MSVQAVLPTITTKPEHAGPEEFAQLIRAVTKDPGYVHHCLRHRREFVARYPDLTEWSAEPLTEVHPEPWRVPYAASRLRAVVS